MESIRVKPAEDLGAMIALVFLCNRKTGKHDRIRTVPFTPGMIIERNGKRYQVDAKGTQRRVE